MVHILNREKEVHLITDSYLIIVWKKTYYESENQCTVIQRVDIAIEQINSYLVDKCNKVHSTINWIKIYPMDSTIHLLKN